MKTYKITQELIIINGSKTIYYEIPANSEDEAIQLVEDCEAFDYVVDSETLIDDSEQIDIYITPNEL